MSEQALERTLEALLFVADGPVAVPDLAKAAQADTAEVAEAVDRMIARSQERGVCIVRTKDRVQMATAPDLGPAIERFLGISETTSLSSAAMETLSIVAYRQPVTRAQIDAIRGVNSDGVLRTLLARQLVTPVGRLQQAGRPVLYGTTFEFLQYFGMTSLDDLPSLPDLGGVLDDLLAAQDDGAEAEPSTDLDDAALPASRD